MAPNTSASSGSVTISPVDKDCVRGDLDGDEYDGTVC